MGWNWGRESMKLLGMRDNTWWEVHCQHVNGICFFFYLCDDTLTV